MNYSFKTEGTTINAWISDMVPVEKKEAGIVAIATVYGKKNGKHKEFHRSVRMDENGKAFFTWNRKKIYTDDFLAFSPEELVKKIDEKDNRVFDDTLCHTLLKYGIDSLHVIINTSPLMRINFGGISVGFECSSNNDEDTIPVEYKFQEEYLRSPKDCYKLKLIPANDDEYDIYPKKDYYVHDLIGLLKCDDFKLVSNL